MDWGNVSSSEKLRNISGHLCEIKICFENSARDKKDLLTRLFVFLITFQLCLKKLPEQKTTMFSLRFESFQPV